MEKDFQEAFYEVDEILKHFPEELLIKIPRKFQKMIKENKSTTYNKKINGLDNLDELKKETIVLLGLIYRDYLCDKKMQKQLIEEEKQMIKKLYDYNNLFKK